MKLSFLKAGAVLLAVAGLSACSESETTAPQTEAKASTATMVAKQAPEGNVIEVRDGASIQEAVKVAKSGDTIRVYPGLYKETVYVDKNGITLEGVPQGGEWPMLDGEDTLNDGFLIAGHGVTVDRFYIRRFKGNGIMTQGANNFRITNNIVEGDSVYGIFPQFSNNGLVADNVTWLVHDAAIYVGMCENIDVVRNETYGSVMGIEIENSHDILVEANYVHDNSSGIQVTLLPGLPVKTAKNTVIRRNIVTENNLPNFAPKGSSAANMPAGTGIVVFAADDTVIEKNIVRNNNSAGVVTFGHDLFPGAKDPDMEPNVDGLKMYDNVMFQNGGAPMEGVKAFLASIGFDKGADLMVTGPGEGACVKDRASISHLNIDHYADCAPDATSLAIATFQLPEPVEARVEPDSWRGRFAYNAVCAGCHTYKMRLVGPPMITAKALYRGRPEALADYMAHPVRKREDYPEMPPQAYLTEEVRLKIANYILNELGE